jgi:uncharacterized membrane protein YuzA (DUF378 family)
VFDVVALILVIIGGLNWLLVGFGGYDWDIVASIFGWDGVGGAVTRIIFVVVGLAAIYVAVRSPAMSHFKVEPHERSTTGETRPTV